GPGSEPARRPGSCAMLFSTERSEPPAAIKPMETIEREDLDVIVVGAGNAATCAALSAQENGARVLMLEIAPEEARAGNSAFTGGAFRVVYHGFPDLARLIPDISEHEV